jgi:allantoinase
MPSLRSRLVVTPDGVRPATVRHEGGVIVDISDNVPDADYGNSVVMPGLVDSHVHVNEPGRTDWEGFATATRAAAAGGTTTVVDMPLNSIPPTTSVSALEAKREAARGKLSVDVAFWGGLVPGSVDEIDPLVDAGVCGFKSFLVDSGVPEFPSIEPDELLLGMARMRDRGVPSLLHAEDPAALFPIAGDPTLYESYLASRPSEGESAAVRLAGEMSAATTARVHVLHVSSADAAAVIGTGPPSLSGETCPHYLTFCSEDVPQFATPFKCAPPIRSSEHREALWDALRAGHLSMVVSDHSPAPAEVKAVESGDFSEAWGGVGSLQLRLQAMFTGAAQRNVGFLEMADWLARQPARLAGLDGRKGSIEVGKDADFVVFDPEGAKKVRGDDLEHRHPITPYEGMVLRGTVVETILRGESVFADGQIHAGRGRMLIRGD